MKDLISALLCIREVAELVAELVAAASEPEDGDRTEHIAPICRELVAKATATALAGDRHDLQWCIRNALDLAPPDPDSQAHRLARSVSWVLIGGDDAELAAAVTALAGAAPGPDRLQELIGAHLPEGADDGRPATAS